MKIINLEQYLKEKIVDEWDIKLKELLEKNNSEFTSENLNELEGIGNKIHRLSIDVNHLQYSYTNKEEINDKELELKHQIVDVNIKLSEVLYQWKPKSEKHYYELLEGSAQKKIIAIQKLFDILQKKSVVSNVLLGVSNGVVCESQSPYYKIKTMLRNVQTIYDEIAVYYISIKDYKKAHNTYFILGELLIKEIHYARLINDNFLYDEESYGELFYWAGLAFYKGFNVMKNRFILTLWGNPCITYLKSNIDDIFQNSNIQLSMYKLSIKSFENAKQHLLNTGEKYLYLKCKDYLEELKEQNNDFEYIITKLIQNISKQFTENQNYITKQLTKPNKILEGDVRDYFLSHINIVKNEIAVAENIRTIGFSDMTISGKEYSRTNPKAICEFKVWGRNSSGSHSYKDVVNQLKGYLTDFEKFGIIVMINPNKSSIKDKYIEEIINNDNSYVTNSLDNISSESDFVNLETQYYVDDTKNRKIKIYHYILNISNLVKEQ